MYTPGDLGLQSHPKDIPLGTGHNHPRSALENEQAVTLLACNRSCDVAGTIGMRKECGGKACSLTKRISRAVKLADRSSFLLLLFLQMLLYVHRDEPPETVGTIRNREPRTATSTIT